MSKAAKFALSASIFITTGIIFTVHYMQKREKTIMQLGIQRDAQLRQQRNKN